MADTSIGITLDSPELEMLKLNKESGYNYRERRQEDWLQTYMQYRGKVTINRMTQRQSVHIPLMKQVVRSLLKDVDDLSVLYFESIDKDKQKEVFQNEYWKWTVFKNNMELQDIVDKKQVILYGRSFDQWQIVDGMIKQTIQDPQDILVSRYTDPTDLDTARFLIHQHIFRSMSELRKNKDYDQEALDRLEDWHESEQGVIKVSENKNISTEKNRKMEEMGVPDVESPGLGEAIFETTMHFVMRAEDGDEEEIWLYVEAEDQVILMKKRLEEVIGKTKDHFWRKTYPYVTWADDLERQDFWSDGIGDIVRPGGNILNAWFSQLVENRTLRNFGMQFYDSTAAEGNWSPNTYNPAPFGFYGVPGDPNKLIMRMEIPDLSESLDEMEYLTSLIEQSTGATKTQQGNVQDKQITLGEVQLALGEAKERIKGMSKFYTPAWKRRGLLFTKLIEAGHGKLDAVKIQSRGRNTSNLFEREITPKDWMTSAGYLVKVWSQDEKDTQDTNTIQKLQASMQFLPGNAKLLDIIQRKVLEFAGLPPEDTNEVIQEERDRRETVQSQPDQLPAQPTGQPAIQPPIPLIAPPVEATPKKKSKKPSKTVKKLKSLKKKIKDNE